jgi:hypothetical protein
MGQFYKGTEATFLDDAMFKLPYELMGSVIDKKDKEVEKAIEAKTALSALLDAKGLKVDDPRLQEIIGGYTNQVGDISSGIYGDAMNAARYMPKIEDLKRKITSDWKMGEVAKIQGNLANYNAWEEETKKQIDKAGNKVTPQQWELLKAKKLAEFKGTNYKSPDTYNTFAGEALLEKKPTDEFIDGMFKEKVGTLKSVSWDNEKGNWRVQGERGTAGFTDAELKNAYKAALAADPNQLGAMQQLNSLGVPGYQESLFDQKGVPIVDDTVNNAFNRELEYAKQKYGIVNVKRSDSNSLSETGKQELAYGIKQRDEEQPVGYSFSKTQKHVLTHDYKTYNDTKTNIINAKNNLLTTLANKLNLSGEERKNLAKEIGAGNYSRILKGIPDSEGYVEQFKELFAEQKLQGEVEKDYNQWANKTIKDSKGNIIITLTEKGKKRNIAINPKTEEGKSRLFNIYSNQPGYQKNVSTEYIADNISANIGPKATIAIGKTLADLGGSLSLNFSSGKGSKTVFTSPIGKEKVRLVTAKDYNDYQTSQTGEYSANKKTYKIDEEGNYLIPAREPNGNIQAQNMVTLGLATGLNYVHNPDTIDESGTEVSGLIVNGVKQNLKFKTGSARVVDKHIDGKPAISIPVSGGDFDVIATVDASRIQQPDLQNWINNPGRKANQVYNTWKTKVPPVLTPTPVANGLTIGKSSAKGWYVVGKSGNIAAPAEGTWSQEALQKMYYDKARQD